MWKWSIYLLKWGILVVLCFAFGCENGRQKQLIRAQLEAEHQLLKLQHKEESVSPEPPEGYILEPEPNKKDRNLYRLCDISPKSQETIVKEETKKKAALTNEQKKEWEALIELMIKYRIGMSYQQQQSLNEYLFLQEYLNLQKAKEAK